MSSESATTRADFTPAATVSPVLKLKRGMPVTLSKAAAASTLMRRALAVLRFISTKRTDSMTCWVPSTVIMLTTLAGAYDSARVITWFRATGLLAVP